MRCSCVTVVVATRADGVVADVAVVGGLNTFLLIDDTGARTPNNEQLPSECLRNSPAETAGEESTKHQIALKEQTMRGRGKQKDWFPFLRLTGPPREPAPWSPKDLYLLGSGRMLAQPPRQQKRGLFDSLIWRLNGAQG